MTGLHRRSSNTVKHPKRTVRRGLFTALLVLCGLGALPLASETAQAQGTATSNGVPRWLPERFVSSLRRGDDLVCNGFRGRPHAYVWTTALPADEQRMLLRTLNSRCRRVGPSSPAPRNWCCPVP